MFLLITIVYALTFVSTITEGVLECYRCTDCEPWRLHPLTCPFPGNNSCAKVVRTDVETDEVQWILRGCSTYDIEENLEHKTSNGTAVECYVFDTIKQCTYFCTQDGCNGSVKNFNSMNILIGCISIFLIILFR